MLEVKRMKLQKKWMIPLLTMVSSTTFAQAFLMNDASLKSDLNWLNQQGVIQVTTSTWPLSTAAIQDALQHAKPENTAQRKVLDSIQRKIDEGNTLSQVELKASTDRNKLPATFGNDNASQNRASFTLQKSTENWDAHLQVNAEDRQRIDNGNNVNVEGSYLAGKIWNQWISFGSVPTFWGPGHDGSLIRGDATRPVPGFLMQRAEQKAFETKWLSWIGPWQYQIFAGQLQRYTAVPKANLIGMRLTIQPFQSLELGASRTFQIGGRGQPSDFDAYWNAFIGRDNAYENNSWVNNDNASNQLGGFDARLSLQPLFNIPVGLYGQMIGEDESGKLPSRNLYLAGIDFSSNYGELPYQLYAEWADTRTSGKVEGYTYNHHQYTDGYYQYGYPIGHGMGGDGQMYSLGGNIQLNATNRITGRLLYAKLNQSNLEINKAFPTNDKMKAIELGWETQVKSDIHVQVGAWLGDSDYLKNDSGASLSIKLPLNF